MTALTRTLTGALCATLAALPASAAWLGEVVASPAAPEAHPATALSAWTDGTGQSAETQHVAYRQVAGSSSTLLYTKRSRLNGAPWGVFDAPVTVLTQLGTEQGTANVVATLPSGTPIIVSRGLSGGSRVQLTWPVGSGGSCPNGTWNCLWLPAPSPTDVLGLNNQLIVQPTQNGTDARLHVVTRRAVDDDFVHYTCPSIAACALAANWTMTVLPASGGQHRHALTAKANGDLSLFYGSGTSVMRWSFSAATLSWAATPVAVVASLPLQATAVSAVQVGGLTHLAVTTGANAVYATETAGSWLTIVSGTAGSSHALLMDAAGEPSFVYADWSGQALRRRYRVSGTRWYTDTPDATVANRAGVGAVRDLQGKLLVVAGNSSLLRVDGAIGP